jgi:hypothetical protein
MIVMILASVLMHLMFATFAYGKPVKEPGISFALPFTILGTEDFEAAQPKTRGLADSIEAGRKIILMNKSEICNATTGATSIYHHMSGGHEFKVTHLAADNECFPVKTEEKYPGRFQVAIVGVGSSDIRLASPKDDHSPLPKDIQSKARRLVDNTEYRLDLPDVPPEVLRVGTAALLIFRSTPWYEGPIVWSADHNVFLLEGNCTTGHFFFSVHNKLHLAYTGSYCCDCGHKILFVYDLSGRTPKQVYENGKLSD